MSVMSYAVLYLELCQAVYCKNKNSQNSNLGLSRQKQQHYLNHFNFKM